MRTSPRQRFGWSTSSKSPTVSLGSLPICESILAPNRKSVITLAPSTCILQSGEGLSNGDDSLLYLDTASHDPDGGLDGLRLSVLYSSSCEQMKSILVPATSFPEPRRSMSFQSHPPASSHAAQLQLETSIYSESSSTNKQPHNDNQSKTLFIC